LAQKPTIYKQKITVSDLQRNYYDTLNLTIALHPSETEQRLMARVLAYTINAQQGLSFTKGLSSVDEPDIWVRGLDQQISLWIDIGEPAVDRIKKATRRSKRVRVYSFNTKSETWWQQCQTKMARLNVSVYRFDSLSIEKYAELLERTMDYSVTITEDSAYIATQQGECEVGWQSLQEQS